MGAARPATRQKKQCRPWSNKRRFSPRSTGHPKGIKSGSSGSSSAADSCGAETSGADGVPRSRGPAKGNPIRCPHGLSLSRPARFFWRKWRHLNPANLLPALCLSVGQADDLTHLQPGADLDDMAAARLRFTVKTFSLHALPSKSVPKIRTRTRISLRGSRRVAIGRATNLFSAHLRSARWQCNRTRISR